MKKVGFIVVLGLVAILGAYVWLEQMPQKTAASGTDKLIHDTKQVVKNTERLIKNEALNDTQKNFQGTVHHDFNRQDAISGTTDAQADMKITAYVPSLQDITYTDDQGAVHRFQVEIAARPMERQKGLMFRHEMPENQGMLFVFDAEANRSFWMKNTYIPLDMFFIKADGTIDSIHKNAIPLDTTFIYSDGPAKFVLEVNAGIADKLGIKAGDKFQNENFAN